MWANCRTRSSAPARSAEGKKLRPSDLPPKITQKVEVCDAKIEAIKHQLPIGSTLDDFIRKQERIFIRETLKYNEGSREKTASMLGVSIATLYRKMGLKLEREKILQWAAELSAARCVGEVAVFGGKAAASCLRCFTPTPGISTARGIRGP